MKLGDALARLPGFSHAVLIVPDEGGYPLSVATSFRVVDGSVEVTPASTGQRAVRDTVEARLVVSHIRPYPGVGYDQRRYIELSGALSTGVVRRTNYYRSFADANLLAEIIALHAVGCFELHG